MLAFQSNGHLTLGVEIELQLMDGESLDLTPRATDILARLDGHEKVKPEIFQSMLEINSGICRNVQEAERDLGATMEEVLAAADEYNVLLAATGTHPFARYSERTPYPAERYTYLIDRNQWIARRLMICGLHVHIGMRDGDTCIRFNNFFLHAIPHLLALTASSPFWQGEDTGLASSRTTIFESCPTAGHPCRMQDWAEFSTLTGKLMKSGAINSLKDIWWDIRPSPEFGTLEIRACDGVATLAETMAIVAFIHALAHWYDQHADYDTQLHAPYMWMMRENKWRATRHGLDTAIIADEEANTIGMRDDIAAWLHQLAPYIHQLGYESHIATLNEMMERGPSYVRQRAAFARNESLIEVARHNAAEFAGRLPIYA